MDGLQKALYEKNEIPIEREEPVMSGNVLGERKIKKLVESPYSRYSVEKTLWKTEISKGTFQVVDGKCNHSPHCHMELTRIMLLSKFFPLIYLTNLALF